MDQPEDLNLPAQKLSGHLSVAVHFVDDRWFPAHPDTRNRLKAVINAASIPSARSRSGAAAAVPINSAATDLFPIDRALSDPAVMLAGLRSFGVHQSGSLMQQFEELSTEESYNHLNQILTRCTKHAFEPEPWQAATLTDMIVASSAAETLGALMNISENRCSAASTIRNLGHLLLAWNYPHVVRRALATMTLANGRDRTLHKILGFSPHQLMLAVAANWKLAPELRFAVGFRPKTQSADTIDQDLSTGQTLEKITRAADALARGLSALNHPDMRDAWAQGQELVTNLVGKANYLFWSELAERVNARTSFLRAGFEHLFSMPTALLQKTVEKSPTAVAPAETEISSPTSPSAKPTISLFYQNQYAQHVAPSLKEALQVVYINLSENDLEGAKGALIVALDELGDNESIIINQRKEFVALSSLHTSLLVDVALYGTDCAALPLDATTLACGLPAGSYFKSKLSDRADLGWLIIKAGGDGLSSRRQISAIAIKAIKQAACDVLTSNF